MKRLKVCFVDFWEGFNPSDNFFIIFLKRYYEVEVSNNPDYCFFSNYGYENLRFNSCIKIQFVGENMVPDFNLTDYAIGFHHLNFDDRYFRFPLYFIYGYNFIPDGFNKVKNKVLQDSKFLLNRRFCNFVYSNSVTADPIRREFFEKLSLYKKVDSGGKYLNNIGYNINKKLDFIQDYKFTIAFENSVCEGYTTEKIFEPMVVNSIPIYYGNPLVDRDFNSDSFIWMKGPDAIKETIEEIIHLDLDDAAYLEKLSQPNLTKRQLDFDWEVELKSFFENIFNREIQTFKRAPLFGFNQVYLEELKQMVLLRKRQKNINRWKAALADLSYFLKIKKKVYN